MDRASAGRGSIRQHERADTKCLTYRAPVRFLFAAHRHTRGNRKTRAEAEVVFLKLAIERHAHLGGASHASADRARPSASFGSKTQFSTRAFSGQRLLVMA